MIAGSHSGGKIQSPNDAKFEDANLKFGINWMMMCMRCVEVNKQFFDFIYRSGQTDLRSAKRDSYKTLYGQSCEWHNKWKEQQVTTNEILFNFRSGR